MHPYCSPRVLAEDGRDCSTPENGGFLNVMKETEALIKKYGNRHSMAIGELGWSLGEIFSPRLYALKEWMKRSFTPFYKNVEQDGIVLV